MGAVVEVQRADRGAPRRDCVLGDAAGAQAGAGAPRRPRAAAGGPRQAAVRAHLALQHGAEGLLKGAPFKRAPAVTSSHLKDLVALRSSTDS